MLQTQSTRVKAPAKHRFRNRTQLTSAQSNEVTTSTPPGRVVTDKRDVRKSTKFISATTELYISTYNACTLTKDFYLNELTNSIEKYNLEMVCIQEHRITHAEPIKYHHLSQTHTLITSSATLNNSNASVGGVGVVVNNKSLNCLLSAENISSRILVLNFSGNPQTTVICCYSPHNQSSEDEVVGFYEELSEIMEQIPAHNVVFVCGDFNAQLGLDNVLYSYHQQTNRNGEHLCGFMERFDLVAANTRFQKPRRKLWTCQYPNGSRGQVDYILVRQKWCRTIENIETYASTFNSIRSDHKALTAKIKLKLRAPKKKQSAFRMVNFRSLASSKELQHQYAIEVHNRFTTLVEELPSQPSIQEKYDCLGNACSEIGKQILPKKPSKKWSNLHLSHDVVKARQSLRKAIDSKSSTAIAAAREKLTESYKTAEECFIETQVKIIEDSSFSQRHATAWRVLNEVTGRKPNSPPAKLNGSVKERKKQ